MFDLDLKGKKLILVLTTYRTGSTALCDLLSQELDLTNFDELFHWAYNKNIIDQKGFTGEGIVKLMPDHAIHQDYIKYFNNPFVIGLQRRSTLSQITSMYIAHMTKHWHYRNGMDVDSYTLPIDKSEIKNTIYYIRSMLKEYKKFSFPKDVELYYEDIAPKLTKSKYIPYIRPQNYKEIVEEVIYCMKEINNEQN